MKKRKTRKKKVAKKKSAKAVAKKRPSKRPLRTAKPKRRAPRKVVEPSSGWATSSLDPNRAGRLVVERPSPQSRRGRLSGDDQGISRDERLDSESVEELLEEGQTFEAEAVGGVEDALDPDQGEVRTHEVPQDDVPPEYEDKDRL